MRIRRARVRDLAGAARVIAAVAPEGSLGAEHPVEVNERARRLHAILEEGEPAAIWVLEDGDEQIVGFASVSERVRGVLSLGMAILPEARRRGSGRALIRAAVEHGRASSAHKLELEAWTDNAPAITLYASEGFVVEGVRRDHYLRRDGTLRSSVIMALRLDG